MSKVVKIVFWYDRRTRNWVVQRLDEQGNQVGDADYCGCRGSMKSTLEYYAKHWKVPIEKLKR